jgi:hypothetical protein
MNHPIDRARGRARWVLLLLAALVLVGRPAGAALFLNEIRVHGIEAVELYNNGPSPQDLSGWKLRGANGDYVIGEGTIINVGQYLTLSNLGNIFDEIGGETDLIDFVGGTQDRVQYGDAGGAPLPHPAATVSLARAPDAAANPPRDPVDDAQYWTLDFTLTFNAPNNAPLPQLGSSIRINEVDDSDLGTDTVEYYNPFAASLDISLVGWILTDGTTQAALTGTVPGGGVFALTVPTSIETAGVAYLFTPAGVRVDQVGMAGGPVAREEDCYGRCPNGAGPSNGYDYETTGGGFTWITLPCSMGVSNNLIPGCYTSSAPDPIVRENRWGGLKRSFLLR